MVSPPLMRQGALALICTTDQPAFTPNPAPESILPGEMLSRCKRVSSSLPLVVDCDEKVGIDRLLLESQLKQAVFQ